MTYKIFTSGKMSGLTYEQQMVWRSCLENLIKNKTSKRITFIHPPDFEILNDDNSLKWTLNQIADSNIVVVNLSSIEDSIGTLIEIGLVNGLNQSLNKKNYLIGVGELDKKHQWIVQSLFHQEKDLVGAADYITDYLLV